MVFATPARTTYQARIVKPDGYPLEAANVNFRFSILDSPGTCVLYTEIYSGVNMTATGGVISFSLGSGVKTYPVSSTTFAQVFSNITPNMACDASGVPTVYTPTANDGRKIVMQFNDGGGWQTLPAMTINAVPYAMYADNATKFNGMAPSEFVQVSTIPTCAVSSALRYTGASFVCESVVGGGSITSASVITALGFTPAEGASVTTVTANLNSVSSAVFSVSSTVSSLSSSVSSLQSSVVASFAAITNSQWVTSGTTVNYSSGHVGIGTSAPTSLLHLYSESTVFQQLLIDAARNNPGSYGLVFQKSRGNTSLRTPSQNGDRLGELIFQGYTDGTYPGESAKIRVTAAETASASGVGGRIQFMATSVGSSVTTERMRIESDGNVGIGTTTPVTTLDVSGAIRISFHATCSASYAGTIRYNAGSVEYCNGSSWAAFGVSGAGLQSLNGSTSGTQSFAIGTAGTAPVFATANGVHTLNIPLASTATVTAGLLSNADYVSFQNKASSASVTNLISDLNSVSSTLASLSSNVATSFTNLTTTVSAITSSQWTTAASGIYYATGFVAVGASFTGYDFFVRNPSNTNNPMGLQNLSNSGYAGIDIQNASGTLVAGMAYSNPGAAHLPGSMWIGPRTAAEPLHFIAGNVAPTARMTLTASGHVGIGTSTPTARLELAAGASTVAPLKLTSGTLLSSPASGAIEYDGFYYYLTDGINTRRAIATVATPGIFDNATTITNSGNITLVPTGSVIVSSTTASTNSQTGALVVKGGIGVAGDIFVSGTIFTSSNIQGASITATNGVSTPVVQGSPYLLLNPSGGNVGIGTTNPVGLLEIGTNTVSSSAYRFVNAGYQSSMRFVPDNTANWIQSGLDYTSDSKKDLKFSSINGVTTWMTLQASTGNVGIGTSSPSHKLHVYSDQNDSVEILNVEKVNGLGFAAVIKNSRISGAPGVLRLDLPNQGDGADTLLEASSSGTTKFIITGAGQVGIGTTGPTGVLDVQGGTASANTNGTHITLAAQSAGAGNQNGGHIRLIPGVGTGTGARGSVRVGSGTFYDAAHLELASGAPGLAINNTGNSQILLNHAAGGWGAIGNNAAGIWSLGYTNSGSTNLDGSVLTWNNSGNVGIGTSNPETILHIDSVGSDFSKHYIKNRVSSTGLSWQDMPGISLIKNHSGNASVKGPTINNESFGEVAFGGVNSLGDEFHSANIIATQVGTAAVSGPNGAKLRFGTANGDGSGLSTRMTIDNNGNVGIGTLAPNAKLHVKGGSINMESDSTLGILGQISLSGRNTTAALPGYSQWSLYNMNEYGSIKGLSFYEYYDNNNNGILCEGGEICASRVTFAQGGNVGIGVQVPTTTLQVAGQITPSVDNTYSLGTGALRFTAVYAVNGAIQTSDERQKKNITDSDLGLDFINKLRPVSYNWKSGSDTSVHYGLIAQETEKIVNESRSVRDGTPTPIVDYDKDSGRYGLRYTELISPIIKAVQELYSKIMGHDQRLESQERKIASVEAENAQLKKENEEIKARLQRLEKALEKK